MRLVEEDCAGSVYDREYLTSEGAKQILNARCGISLGSGTPAHLPVVLVTTPLLSSSN